MAISHLKMKSNLNNKIKANEQMKHSGFICSQLDSIGLRKPFSLLTNEHMQTPWTWFVPIEFKLDTTFYDELEFFEEIDARLIRRASKFIP